VSGYSEYTHFKMTTGQYAGDNNIDRAIPHSLGVKPKIVLIAGSTIAYLLFELIDTAIAGGGNGYVVQAKDATNFYVGDAGDLTKSGNAIGTNYYWVAMV